MCLFLQMIEDRLEHGGLYGPRYDLSTSQSFATGLFLYDFDCFFAFHLGVIYNEKLGVTGGRIDEIRLYRNFH